MSSSTPLATPASSTAADDRPPAEQPVVGLAGLSESELLTEASETVSMLRQLESYQLRVAYEWAIAHPAIDATDTPEGASLPGVLTEPDTLGGPGTPAVAAFTAESLAVATACSPASASALLADAVDLVHRLPMLWDHVQAGLVPVWKARRVAARTRDLSADAAGWVDRHLAGQVSSLGPARLDRMVAEAAARCDGDTHADRERRAREGWDVELSHPGDIASTSRLVATGDTLDLTRFHDVVCAEADTLAALGDTDELGVRKARALGVIADQQARLDLTTLLGTSSDPWAPETTTTTDHTAARDAALDRRAAKTRLYLHASLAEVLALAGSAGAIEATAAGASVGTAESLGPVTLDLLRQWVGRTRVRIQPVLHVAGEDRWSVDCHDPPPRMAEEVRLRDEVCVFPWCSRPARACDLDHIRPYHPPGDATAEPADTRSPPGQTSPENLAPLCRRHHRAKTTGRWRYQHIDPGEYLWHGPAGTTTLVTTHGTIAVPLA